MYKSININIKINPINAQITALNKNNFNIEANVGENLNKTITVY